MKYAEQLVHDISCCIMNQCGKCTLNHTKNCIDLLLREAMQMIIRETGLETGSKLNQPAPANDTVNHPAHYTFGGVECIEALKAATVGLEGIEAVCTANAIKYLWRWKRKNGVEDLKKAVWYIERLISELTPAAPEKTVSDCFGNVVPTE